MNGRRANKKASAGDDQIDAARTRKLEESQRILNAPAWWWTPERLKAWDIRNAWIDSDRAYSPESWTQAQERSVERGEAGGTRRHTKPRNRFERLAREYVSTEDDLAAARIHATAVLEAGGLPSAPRGLVAALSKVFLTAHPEHYAAQVLESFNTFDKLGQATDLFAAGASYGRMTSSEPQNWKKVREDALRLREASDRARAAQYGQTARSGKGFKSLIPALLRRAHQEDPTLRGKGPASIARRVCKLGREDRAQRQRDGLEPGPKVTKWESVETEIIELQKGNPSESVN